MRVIVDAQLPPGLCGWLKDRGHDAVHVSALAAYPLPDEAIARLAQSQRGILISKDEDFVDLHLPDRFAFLWLRCGNISNRGLIAWLEPQWGEVEERLRAGERLITLG
jgi:predicted nuclease of predicted toxin-antitoxin system